MANPVKASCSTKRRDAKVPVAGGYSDFPHARIARAHGTRWLEAGSGFYEETVLESTPEKAIFIRHRVDSLEESTFRTPPPTALISMLQGIQIPMLGAQLVEAITD